jgi:hypothetical protein
VFRLTPRCASIVEARDRYSSLLSRARCVQRPAPIRVLLAQVVDVEDSQAFDRLIMQNSHTRAAECFEEVDEDDVSGVPLGRGVSALAPQEGVYRSPFSPPLRTLRSRVPAARESLGHVVRVVYW